MLGVGDSKIADVEVEVQLLEFGVEVVKNFRFTFCVGDSKYIPDMKLFIAKSFVLVERKSNFCNEQFMELKSVEISVVVVVGGCYLYCLLFMMLDFFFF